MFMDDSKSSSSDVVAAADPAALMGSRGDKYGGECPLLYNQFELVSPVAKKHQIILLQVNNIAVECKTSYLKPCYKIYRIVFSESKKPSTRSLTKSCVSRRQKSGEYSKRTLEFKKLPMISKWKSI